MSELDALLTRNRAWAARQQSGDPQWLAELAHRQSPALMWIGCADSRVPPNVILDLPVGAIFELRNVANQVHPGDVSVQAAVQFAVEELRVRHIVVCGHTNCGGMAAALAGKPLGRTDNWLRRLGDLRLRHLAALNAAPAPEAAADLLSELNVIEQVRNLSRFPVVQHAWTAGRPLALHGWRYDVGSGLLRDLGVSQGN